MRKRQRTESSYAYLSSSVETQLMVCLQRGESFVFFPSYVYSSSLTFYVGRPRSQGLIQSPPRCMSYIFTAYWAQHSRSSPSFSKMLSPSACAFRDGMRRQGNYNFTEVRTTENLPAGILEAPVEPLGRRVMRVKNNGSYFP